MKSIYPIQRLVETDCEAWARYIADKLSAIVLGNLDELHEVRERLPAVSDEDWEVIEAALKWKITEKLATQLQTSAEGWCEVYYRDLKRRYEEDE